MPDVSPTVYCSCYCLTISSLQLLECALREFSIFRFHFPVNQPKADAAKEQDDRPKAAIILWSELVCVDG
eukprot:scaffold7196_cov78-Skeletonema_dohrnii-CCMP3373.AAC.2